MIRHSFTVALGIENLIYSEIPDTVVTHLLLCTITIMLPVDIVDQRTCFHITNLRSESKPIYFDDKNDTKENIQTNTIVVYKKMCLIVFVVWKGWGLSKATRHTCACT